MTTALKIPALRVGDEKIAERLHARYGLELFRIDEVSVERRRLGLAEQLHQPAVLLDQIIRQHGDADAALAGAQDAEDIIDHKVRRARALAVARHFDQPARALQVRWYVAAEHQHAMIIEIVEGARRAEALEIFRRGVDVEMHREQLALDQVGLRRLTEPDGDIGLAHGEVELLVGGQQRDVDFRIELDELAERRRQPMAADARRRGYAQVAVRPLAAVGQFGARRFEFHEYFVGGAIKQ